MTQNSDTPVKIVPESVPSIRKEGEVYVFAKPAFDFLKAYSVSLDPDVAFTEARIDKKHRSDVLNNPYVQQEMTKIQATYGYGARMTSAYVGGRHMRMMGLLEDDFDASGDKEVRARIAGTYAKMSDAAMKATGLIGTIQTDQLPTVILNINAPGGTANVQVNQSSVTVKPDESPTDANA